MLFANSSTFCCCQHVNTWDMRTLRSTLLLGCDAVWSGTCLFFIPGDGTSKFLWNIVNAYQTAICHHTEDNNIQGCWRQDLKCYSKLYCSPCFLFHPCILKQNNLKCSLVPYYSNPWHFWWAKREGEFLGYNKIWFCNQTVTNITITMLSIISLIFSSLIWYLIW
jgi:hypothetical protein